MSMREQERRKRQAISRADGIKNRIAGRMHEAELLAKESKRRADQVKRRIEVGDVEPRPLPSLREDSLPSMESMESSESMASMESTESPALTGGVPSEEEAYGGGNMSEDMPLAIDPKGAHEELGQRITEDTGSDGDLHLHAQRRADEMKKEMTEDTGAGTDMKEHADRKVEQMGNELLGG
ncbi:MAG: hypothetical protein M3N03_07140 [Actinomycetota bacterium]|jgi:hypothetical protein|nr:hypothetical protein [Actinomycetota bacterium]